MNNSLLKQLPIRAEKFGWPWTEDVNLRIYNSKIEWPKISIVTPSYNQGQFIEETIRSILLQNYPNLEYIVIDGGSTDSTIEILKKYEDWITFWISEKDKGQADAINKGVQKCTGKIFNWINSDDVLASNALLNVAVRYYDGATIAGSVYNFFEKSPSSNYILGNRNLDFMSFLQFKSPFHQPGIWFDLNNFKKVGLLPTNYSYYFDRIFLIDYLLYFRQIVYTEEILVYFRMHEESKTCTISDSKIHEIILHYQYLLTSPPYKEFKKVIKKEINNYLIACDVVNKWKQKRSEIGYLNRLFSYLLLIFYEPKIVFSRYYYTILKQKIILGNPF